MRYGEWRNECHALCRLWIHGHGHWQLKYRLRAVICLFLYTHSFWADGLSEHVGQLAPQETPASQTSAPCESEGQP